ncbi:MAG: hypothetical protein ACLP7O_14275 [Terracidiphilus sp.]
MSGWFTENLPIPAAGYGLRRTALPVTAWPQSVETWLRTIKVLQAQ